MSAEKRGSIAFFATYRPPVPLGIYSCPLDPPPTSKSDELPLITDGDSYNYNARVIPPAALRTILRLPKFEGKYKDADVDSGRLLGYVFVSERGNIQLETLHIALVFDDDNTGQKVEVFSLADVFGTSEFNGVRMEDSGCFAGKYIVYVSTKEPAPNRRQPWTAVYKTDLETGKTERLTPPEQADLSPSVSPSGKMIAVASFQEKNGGWDGEIEDLMTNIFVIDMETGERTRIVRNGGWPTWGSDNVIFFHRKVEKYWGVFQAEIRKIILPGPIENIVGPTDTPRVTPDNIDAMTPAAIDDTTVAVATIREKSSFTDVRKVTQYRHIEIFKYSSVEQQGQLLAEITQKTRPKADHFNPFVIIGSDGKNRIGYHRSKSDLLNSGDEIPRKFHKLKSPDPDVGLFRVSGVFPTFSRDGTKLAFVDNEFKALWVADSQGLRKVFEIFDDINKIDNMFSPVWNQNPKLDILYVCRGPAFSAKSRLDICAIPVLASGQQVYHELTDGFNNAFPSTSPDGKKLVFRSTRDGNKNLYIMEDAEVGEFGDGKITRLTEGPWTDTHCQWSPTSDWIVFSSTRGKPNDAPELDNGLDPGYFAVFLVKAKNPSVVVRVVGSGNNLAGHVNHPFFSPDGKSIVVTADLAAVSVDPISLPLFLHSVRPYGDIFTIDIDPNDICKNEDVKEFKRITHSRYEYSTASWTKFSTEDPNAQWNLRLSDTTHIPWCPYVHPDGSESWHMTGHLCLKKRCC